MTASAECAACGSAAAGFTRACANLTGRNSVKRVRLKMARTVAEAKIALQDLQKDRRDHNLPVLRRRPRLADYWDE